MKHLLAAAVMVTATATLTVMPTTAHAMYVSGKCAGKELVGHRGTVGYTENTVRSFEAARVAGADRVETDIRMLKDGSLVLMHDSTVDRTTTATGAVSDKTISQWNAIRANDGQPVPTLKAALDWQKRTGAGLQLEIKQDLDETATARVASLVKTYGLPAKTVVISFRAADLRDYAKYDAVTQTGFLADGYTKYAVWLKNTVGADWLLYNSAKVTAVQVTEAKNAGLKVGGWTPDDATGFQNAINIGVDEITTNRIANLKTWCGTA